MPRSLELNSVLQSLPVYQPGRPIEEVARELGLRPKEIIKLASNENPLGPSPRALAAMREALETLHSYPDGNAFYLKRKLAEKLELDPANLILGNGSNEIIEFVGHALMKPESEIVFSEYCFAVYPIVTHLFGATPIVVPAKDYGHDLPAMLRTLTPRTRVLFVANPNNPTGTRVRENVVREFIHEVPDDVLIVMDEAYFEFLDEPTDLLPMIRDGAKKNLLLMRTFSKIYGLAGLRLGYGIGHSNLIANLEKIRQPFNINALVQAGALAALDDDKHLEATRANNSRGLHFYESVFQEMGLEFVPSSANFVLVRVGNGGQIFQALQRRGIVVRPMGGYQLPDWIRISIGTSAENRRCIEALKLILQNECPPATETEK